jgi:hypothetical protein
VGAFFVFMDNTAAIQEAMSRRGMGGLGATQQMAPGSIAPQPMPQPTEMDAAAAALPPEMGQQQPMGAPAQPTQPDSDTTIAMKALATVVTNDSKMKKDLVAMRGTGGV